VRHLFRHDPYATDAPVKAEFVHQEQRLRRVVTVQNTLLPLHAGC
jgi:hypothetical protein